MDRPALAAARPLHPAQIFRWVVLGLVAGFAVGVFARLTVPVAVVASLGVLVLILTKRVPQAVGLLVFGCLLALTRAGVVPLPPTSGVFVGPQHFEATIVAEPKLSERSRRYVVRPDVPGVGQVVLVTLPYKVYQYGERLQVSCKNVEVVDFAGYTNQGLWRQCAFPDVEVLAGPAPSLRGALLSLKYRASTYVERWLKAPDSALASGMLWGDYSRLPNELIEDFRRTGTSHLLAVSGYNVMVLSEILFAVLIALGLWRKQASVVVLLALVLFTLFTGAEASVVRAAVMASLLVVARQLARKPDRVNVLLGTAAVMLLVNPRLILDLGFELSFGAMTGLMFLSPMFEERFVLLPNTAGLRQSFAQTFAATIATLPIILLRLGELSLVSPFANVLVGPVVALVFALGLPLLVLGSVHVLATPIAWMLTFVLSYVIFVVQSLASLPWALATGTTVTWIGVVVLYAGLGWWLWRGQESAQPA
jgi:competence protein ComEC